jgi:hypothetical protein
VIGAVALVVTWAAAGACAHVIAKLAGARGVANVVVASAFAAGLLAVVPGELCRITSNMAHAMFVAAVLFGVVAFALSRSLIAPATPTLVWTNPSWPAYVVGALGFACVAYGAVTRNFFDEEHHVPMLTVIARGVVPPIHPLVPGEVIPYHWGIDALYAQLHVAGLRPDRAIDVVTILSWPLLWCAAALFGATLGKSYAKRGATFGAIVSPLAGSALAWPLHDGMGILQLGSPYPASWIDWTKRPPPITADFFQHPQGLAFSLVLVVLALTLVEKRAAAALLLALLSLVQAIHFLVLGFGLFAACVVDLAKTRDERAFAARAMLLAFAFVAAVLFGGFFAPGASTASSLVWGVDFFGAPSLVERVLHHLAVFGLPLLLLPFVVVRATENRTLRIAMVAGSCSGFFLPNVVVYANSWDIVKLFSAGAFLAGIGFADSLARLTTSRAKLALTTVAAAFTIWFPLAWMATRTILQGQLGVPVKHDWRLRDDLLAAGDAFSPLIPSRARVLMSDPEMARMNGFLAPGFDPKRFANGHILDFNAERRLESARQVAIRNLDANALLSLDVDYAILSTAEVQRLHAQLEGIPKLADAGAFSLWKLAVP